MRQLESGAMFFSHSDAAFKISDSLLIFQSPASGNLNAEKFRQYFCVMELP